MDERRLRTTRVRIRHVRPDDYVELHRIESDPETAQTWRYRGDVGPIEEYEARLWQQTTAILVVESVASGALVGYCQLYDVDLRAEHGWWSLYAAPQFRGTGLLMEGFVLFTEWVFTNWPLRWLYAHSFEANVSAFDSGIRRGDATRLGILRERVVVDGRPMDVHVIGLRREHYLTCRQRARLHALQDRVYAPPAEPR